MRKCNAAMANRYPITVKEYTDENGVFDVKGYRRAMSDRARRGNFFANNKGFQIHSNKFWANLAVSMLPKGADAQV